MSLSVEIGHRRGDFRLDLTFSSEARIVALHGPSGAGKSTALHVIAGLIRPDSGRVVIGGALLTDTARGVHVATHRRRIGYVFQDIRLFPHLSVRGNLRYGERLGAREGRFTTLDEVTTLLGIGPLLDRRPSTLSGGEKQRVAIGRALLAAPRLLLLDEPLASLDQARREETLPYLVRLCRDLSIPALYVSHRADEIAAIGAEVVPVGPASNAAGHGEAGIDAGSVGR